MTSRGRIAIYSEYLYPALVPSGVPFAGGSETQLVKMAHGLHARGFDVTAISCDFGQPDEVIYEGIRVMKTFARDQGLPVLRFFHPRLSRAAAALWRADADVYYTYVGGMSPGITHDVAKLRGAGFINHIAHDDDCARSGLHYLNARDRWWHVRALRGADALLAQTEWQRSSLRSEFGLASEIMPNLAEIPARAVDPGQQGAVVWLGTYKAMKRPDWFVRLAAEFPERRFIMSGVVPPPPLGQEPWEAARAAAARLPNLDVREFLEHSQVTKLFEGASLLVHTSHAEGFSNVLLEAWAHGLPTVSCVNPDGLVTSEGLGGAATDFEGLVKSTAALLAAPEARRAAGARARAYVQRRHSPETVLNQLAGIADRVIAARRTRRKPNAGE